MNAITQAVEAVRGAFAPQRPNIEQCRADVARAESAVAAAKAAANKAAEKHSEQAFELMSRDDDGAALNRSRAAADEAQARVNDAEAALRVARSRLAAAADAQDRESAADAWEVAASLQKRRIAAFERSQKLLDQWLATLPGLLEATEDAYSALPVKPDFRPASCSANGLAVLVELYIFAHSDGWLCRRAGPSAHVAKQRPSLVTEANDMSHRLLAADPRKGVQS